MCVIMHIVESPGERGVAKCISRKALARPAVLICSRERKAQTDIDQEVYMFFNRR